MKISLDRLLHIDGIAALTAGISLLLLRHFLLETGFIGGLGWLEWRVARHLRQT